MKSNFYRLVSALVIMTLLLVFVPLQEVQAATYITTSQSWPSGTPMMDDVVIQNGATLTIGPGTIVPVFCTDIAPYALGVDANRVEIIVENGGLIIDGAVINGITGQGGCWYGIRFTPGTSGLIQNSTITDAVIGITVDIAQVDIVGNLLRNMLGNSGSSPGATGLMGAGIKVMNTPSPVNILSNTIYDIFGGNGVAGQAGLTGAGVGVSGTPGGYGGGGGLAAGIYMDSVNTSPYIIGNDISSLIGGFASNGGNGGDGAGGANQAGPTPPTGGGDGGAGGDGGDGGDAIGIYANASDFIAVDNEIYDLYGSIGGNGGNGGHGGKGGDASPMYFEPGMDGLPGANGGNGGQGGAGGEGGEAVGIYEEGSSLGIADHNEIYNIFGANGGDGGDGGSGGPGGLGGVGGDALEMGIIGAGGAGGNGGSAGNGGIGGGGGLAAGIISDISLPNVIDRNIIDTILAGDGGLGGLGGCGGQGGIGGFGGNDIFIMSFGGPGGDGGRGGNAGTGGDGGLGGYALGIALWQKQSLITPVTNNDISEIAGGLGGSGNWGGPGGNGAQGGDGGIGITQGPGGNGGSGGIPGNGGNGGNSGFASGIDVYDTGPDLTNNTIVDISIFEFGGSGGLGGSGGTGGPGGLGVPPGNPGTSTAPGNPGVIGSVKNAFGIYLEAYGSANPQVYNNIIVNNINNGPSSLDIGIYQWPGSNLGSLDYNDVWNWTTLYNPPTIFGANDFSQDPLFVGLYDHHLTKLSPCIDAANNMAPSHPPDDRDFVPRDQDGNRDGIPGFDMGAYEYWVISIVKTSDHSPSQLVYYGDDVVYTLTINTVTMGPYYPSSAVTITESVPTGMSLVGSVVCSSGSIINSPSGFSWSGTVNGTQDETCTFTGRVTSFHTSFANDADYTDRDGSWSTNEVVNYWNYKIFLPLVLN